MHEKGAAESGAPFFVYCLKFLFHVLRSGVDTSIFLIDLMESEWAHLVNHIRTILSEATLLHIVYFVSIVFAKPFCKFGLGLNVRFFAEDIF